MAEHIEAWYTEVDRDSSDRLGLAGMLFQACSNILRGLISGPAKRKLGADEFDALRTEAQRFSLWGDGFDVKDGALDEILAHSSNLRQSVIYFLDACGTSLSNLAGEYPAVSQLSDFCKEMRLLQAQAEFIKLKFQNDVVDSKEEAKKSEVAAIDLVVLIEDLEISDCGSSTASNRFEETLDDLKGYIDCLLDLAPALENPAEDFTHEDQLVTSSAPQVVPADQRFFFAEIVSQWPSIDKELARRLAEANRKREQRLSAKLIKHRILDEDEVELSLAQDDHASLSPISRTQTMNSAVVFSYATSLRSDTSVGTSVNDTYSYSVRRRVPQLPENHEWGTAFQCVVCGDFLKSIKSPASWKKHVFRDLCPYICTYSGCGQGGIAFDSEREWTEHEFKKHRVEKYWSCLYCPKESFDNFALCQEHIIQSHVEAEYKALTISQRWEVAEATSLARIRSRSAEKQECPFCLTVVANTIPKLGAHVGKHLREIALAAIPWSVFGGDSENKSETYMGEEAEEDEISEGEDEVLDDIDPESETILPWILNNTSIPTPQAIRAAYNYDAYHRCIGMTMRGSRCKLGIPRSRAYKFLEGFMKLQNPLHTESAGISDLEELASNALCVRYHQAQAPEIAEAWLKHLKRMALNNQNLADEIDEDSFKYLFDGALRQDFTCKSNKNKPELFKLLLFEFVTELSNKPSKDGEDILTDNSYS